MRFMLFLIFVTIPIIEIVLFINIGSAIGWIITILLIIFTAILGSFIIRTQGLAILTRFQTKINSGEIPAKELGEGLALIIAGAFLLTPGFFTDTVGFLLLIPHMRKLIWTLFLKNIITSNMASNMASTSGSGFTFTSNSPRPDHSGRKSSDENNVIDLDQSEYDRQSDKN